MDMTQQIGNPIQLLGQTYKKNLKRSAKAMTLDQFKADPVKGVAAVKMDGEFTVMVLDETGLAMAYSPGKLGMVRWSFAACKEAAKLLSGAGYKTGIFFCELYVVDKDDKPCGFGKVLSKLMNRQGAPFVDEELRLGVFDVHSLDDKPIVGPYADRLDIINKTFYKGKFIHPAYSSSNGVTLFERYVNEEGFEGLVVRMPTGKVFKVKNRCTVDAVIYAIEKKGERMATVTDSFGSVDVGLLLPDGSLIDLGAVASGWDEAERRALFKSLMADKFYEDAKRIYVKPKRLIEVAYFEVQDSKPVSNFGVIKKDGTFDAQSKKTSTGFSPRFPKRIKFVTPDGKVGDYPEISDHPKTVNTEDIGVNQIPEFAELYGA